jgi:hypothetical protein
MNTSESIYESAKILLAVIGLWKVVTEGAKRVAPRLRRLIGNIFRVGLTPASLKVLTEIYSKEWGESTLFEAKVGEARVKYPFFCNPEWLFQTRADDEFVVPVPIDHTRLPVDKWYLLKKKIAHRLWNGDLYFLDSFDAGSDKKPKLGVGLGKYFQFVSECKQLEDMSAKLRTGDGLPKSWPKLPTNRDYWAIKPEAAGIGVISVVIGQMDQYRNEYGVIIQRRSNETVGSGGLYCPCPTFAFQPFVDSDPLASLSLKHQLYREIAEEYFGRIEAQIAGSEGSKGQISSAEKFRFYEGINEIDKSLAKGNSDLVVLGFGLDGPNLEPNLAIMLLINDPEVFSSIGKRITGNWENTSVEVHNINSPKLQEWLRGHEFTCGGAFALTRSLAYLKEATSLHISFV